MTAPESPIAESAPDITPEATWARAGELIDSFKIAIADLPYEAKGVLYSEMLFLNAAVGPDFDALILESGRARGQSTHILSLMYPAARIRSVELLRDHADATVAEARLADRPNVQLDYGDSRALLADWIEPDAVVVIDGPKGFRAIKLALDLLRTGRPRCVFVHDTYQGDPTRRFIDHHLPESLSSDAPEFVDQFKHLDDACWDNEGRDGHDRWLPYQFEGRTQQSYGPTIICIPFRPGRPYRFLACLADGHRFMDRLRGSISKRVGG